MGAVAAGEPGAQAVSALAEEIKSALREVLREELAGEDRHEAAEPEHAM